MSSLFSLSFFSGKAEAMQTLLRVHVLSVKGKKEKTVIVVREGGSDYLIHPVV